MQIIFESKEEYDRINGFMVRASDCLLKRMDDQVLFFTISNVLNVFRGECEKSYIRSKMEAGKDHYSIGGEAPNGK